MLKSDPKVNQKIFKTGGVLPWLEEIHAAQPDNQHMTIIQIYELQTPQDAAKAVELGVDHVGSVLLHPHDASEATIQATIQRTRALGAVSSLIPLFSEPEVVLAALARCQPDVVHFCEDLHWGDVPDAALQQAFNLQQAVRRHFPAMRIMRSIPIGRPGAASIEATLALAQYLLPVSDIFLTDTRLGGSATAAEPVSGFIGITGQTCDWSAAAALVRHVPIPVILAGGLTPVNVGAGITAVSPWGVDSCTGTNQQDAAGQSIRFQKDWHKVAALVRCVREMDAHL